MSASAASRGTSSAARISRAEGVASAPGPSLEQVFVNEACRDYLGGVCGIRAARREAGTVP